MGCSKVSVAGLLQGTIEMCFSGFRRKKIG